MCVICVKPLGKDLPEESILRQMWNRNPDGAGMMYARNGKVVIHKGFMKYPDFIAALEAVGKTLDWKQTTAILHFRIGTAGGNTPENTHPFPVCENLPALQQLEVIADLGVAHNGVIPVKPRLKTISDTMEYILSTLAPLYNVCPEFYRSQRARQHMEDFTKSRLVFLNGQGEYQTVGSWIPDDGYLYSNDSYKPFKPLPFGAWGHWGDDEYWGSETLPVMPLPDECYLVDMETGDAVGADEEEFFMDEQGNCYAYDDMEDACYPLVGWEPFTSNGTPPRFRAERGFLMNVWY